MLGAINAKLLNRILCQASRRRQMIHGRQQVIYDVITIIIIIIVSNWIDQTHCRDNGMIVLNRLWTTFTFHNVNSIRAVSARGFHTYLKRITQMKYVDCFGVDLPPPLRCRRE